MKTTSTFRARACILQVILGAAMQSVVAQGVQVRYLHIDSAVSQEDRAAIAWLTKQKDIQARVGVPMAGTKIKQEEVLWIHLVDSSAYEQWRTRSNRSGFLAQHYRSGARVLLTGFATLLLNDLGVEPRAFQIQRDSIKNDWLFDKRGFQSFRGHPLFVGLFGGDYVWDPDEDQVLEMIGYFDGSFPELGRVVAVDKAYVYLYEKRKTVFEYSNGSGMILAIGGGVFFGRTNNARPNLERFVYNALHYLSGSNASEPKTYWERFENTPRRFECTTRAVRAGSLDISSLPPTGLSMRRSVPTSNSFDVGGRRALVMGKELGGIDEIWIHPFRVLRDLEIGVIGSDSVTWLSHVPASVEVRPESFLRTYRAAGGEIREMICASLDYPGCFIRVEADHPMRLVVRYASDLRWMWPYDANALGDVHFGYDEALHAHHVRDKSGDFSCIMGGSKQPVAHLEGQYTSVEWTTKGMRGNPTTENRVSAMMEYALRADEGLTLVAVGTSSGMEESEDAYRAIMANPSNVISRQVEHYRQLFDRSVQVVTPDAEFNALSQWSIAAVDRFFAHTPGVGTGLLAGYSTTAHGWDGGQKNSGRPGYAWYFGRDAVWSGFAIDDYGDHEMVKRQLEFLRTYQDMTGKIFHEISTSGLVNFDASDATPLYVILAGHYLRASGDRSLIRSLWPSLIRAMEYMASTDTDGDHLIENTNVGHGWVEGGKLFGVHTELYLAAAWQKALVEMGYIARALGRRNEAETYASKAAAVREIINREFWNPKNNFYRFGKNRDGSFSDEPTVMPAVAMYWDILVRTNTRGMLNAYASNEFSADWGVRILGASSPLFNPRGYHYGSIWPLFTGWCALAEYAMGNPASGFSHIMNNMSIKNHWSLGYVEEVMHGAIYQPSGVCPHQCWSETNILHPLLNGMIGWRPDAVAGRARLTPQLPLHWDTIAVKHLRMGDARISMSMMRSIARTEYWLKLEEGSPIMIDLVPSIPLGMKVTRILIGGKVVQHPCDVRSGLLETPIAVKLSNEIRIVLEHEGGLGLCPVVLRPSPGDSSQGYRIISETMSDGRYLAVVEGKRRTDFAFQLRTFGATIAASQGCEITDTADQRFRLLNVRFEDGEGNYARKTVTLTAKSH